jgi:hypothetical protein
VLFHYFYAYLQNEEYIKIVKDCIAEVIGQYKTEDNENMFDIKFSIDDQLFWETLKMMLFRLLCSI